MFLIFSKFLEIPPEVNPLGLPCAVFHGTIANFNLWKVNQVVRSNSTPSKDFENDLLPRLTMKPYAEITRRLIIP